MHTKRDDADIAVDTIGGNLDPATLLELAFFALDQAHRLSATEAARHFDAAAMALVAANAEAHRYAAGLGGRMPEERP